MTPTTHPAIIKAIALHEDSDESGPRRPLEPHEQALCDQVNAIRSYEAGMRGDAVRKFRDGTQEYEFADAMLRGVSEQDLYAALGRYMEADKRRHDAMEEV
jgi:hypothetical protein